MVNRNGFTLIECMVALMILSGLLFTFAIATQGFKLVNQQHNYEIQKVQVTRLIDRLENDAWNYQILRLLNKF